MYQLDFKLLCYFFEININTSFIKSVFISLLDYYDFNFIDQYLSFTNLTKQINILILRAPLKTYEKRYNRLKIS
ncbi:hypothetical protein LPICM17_110054 [Lactococcus piscium]|nr:hypothetical protein LPICM17_110054 [Lactococcus piscium]